MPSLSFSILPPVHPIASKAALIFSASAGDTGVSSASAVVALPMLHMKLGLPDGGSKPTDNTERKAYDLLSEGFGPGFNGVLTVVVDGPGVPKDKQDELAKAVTGRPVSFGQATTGTYGEVAWISLYDSIEQVQAAEETLGADPGFVELLDQKASKAYLAGQATQTLARKLI